MKSTKHRNVRTPDPPPKKGNSGQGGQHALREANIRRLLALVRKHGHCSRADLVRHSGLSAPTISSGVEFLEELTLVESMGIGLSSGGRPPQVIRFNSKFGYVIGADIGTTGVRTALADLGGTIIEESEAPTNSASDPKSVTVLIENCIRELVHRAKIPRAKILGLGVAVPGITNVSAGVVVASPNLMSGWHDVPLRETLEARTGISTTIENDTNLSAMGEGWCGLARGVKNFVFVTVATGIGAGIMIDGKLYHGSTWAAGEIGYLYVPGTDEAPLAIYRHGALETVIGARAIEQSWREARAGLGAEDSPLPDELRVSQIFDLAADGQVHAAAILQRTARILADAITNVCVILNVSLVVIGGRVASHPALFGATCHIIEHNNVCRPRIVLSSLQWRAPLLGAIRLALSSAELRLLPYGTEATLGGSGEASNGIGALEVPPDRLAAWDGQEFRVGRRRE